MRSRQKLMALLGATAIVTAGIIAYGVPAIKAQAISKSEIVEPASALEQLRNQAKEQGMSLDMDIRQTEFKDPILLINLDIPGTTEVIRKAQTPDASLKLLSHPDLETAILKSAQTEYEAINTFHPKDILTYRPTRATRIISRSLLAQAKEQQPNTSPQDTIKTIDLALKAVTSATQTYEPGAIVARFGIELEAYRMIFELLSSPATTKSEIQDIKNYLNSLPRIPSVTDVLKRHVQELVVAARNIDNFTDGDISTLNTEQRNEGPPNNHPKIKEAMEARLIEYYLECLEVSKDLNNEEAGYEIDLVTNKWVQTPNQGHYMIRTVGFIYEQMGRNMHRLSQARTGLTILAQLKLSDQTKVQTLPENLANQTLDNKKIIFEIDNSQGEPYLVSKSIIEDGEFRGTPFETSQQAGVRIAIDSQP